MATEETVVAEQAPLYTFRKLKSTDLFLMIKLVKKLGLENIAEAIDGNALKALLAAGEKTEQDYYVAGKTVIDIVQVIIGRLEYCQKEIYDLLEATSNLSREELENLDIDVFIAMIVEFTRKEEFKQLFTRAASLLKKEK